MPRVRAPDKVWYPGKSVAASQDADGCEEGGRGWSAAAPEAKFRTEPAAPLKSPTRPRRVKVPRRETLAVTYDGRPATRSTGDAKCEGRTGALATVAGADATYSTIEQRSCGGTASLLDCAREHEPPQRADFCGWTEREVMAKYGPSKTSSNSHMSGTAERSSLQTPADGHRSNLSSRAGSRCSGGRRERYEFRHLPASQDYIEHYRQLYCYTTLSCPRAPPLCEAIAESAEGDPEDFMPIEVRCLYRGDPYLHELASRLGVRSSLQNREQKLLKTQRPTPPSIVKRSRDVANLAVHAQGKKEEEVMGSNESSEKVSKESSEVLQTSPKASRPRPFSRSVHQSDPLELPTIPKTPSIPQRIKHRKDNSNSVISVTKYLRVSSHTQPNTDTLDEMRTAEDKDSAHSLTEELSSTSSTLTMDVLSEILASEEPATTRSVEDSRRARFSLPEQLPLLSEHQKERLISQKAHALGLLSRGWSKAPQIRRIMSSYIRESSQDHIQSRPVTSGETKRTSKEEQMSPALTKDKKSGVSQKKGDRQPQSRSKDNSKLDRLKSIYKPSEKVSQVDKKREPSRMKSVHRCESRLKSRPTTGLNMYGTEQQDKGNGGSRGSFSRPLTRLGRKSSEVEKRGGRLPTATVKELEIDDEYYWKELPSQSPSRPVTSYRHKQLSSSESAQTPSASRPVTRNGYLTGRQRDHSMALALRLRRPQAKWEVPTLQPSDKAIQPGSTPKQITAHVEHVKRKFDGILDIHKQKLIPA